MATKQKPKPISYYRKAHKAIPDGVYKKSVKGQASKTMHDAWGSTYVVHKNTYAPWGCPPSGKEALNGRYKPLKDTLTAKGVRNGFKGHPLAKPIRKAKKSKSHKQARSHKAVYDEYAYRRAMDSYEDEMARRDMVYSDARSVKADLEDMGYSDIRKNWKRTGTRTQFIARKKIALQEMKDRGWY